MEEKLHCLLVGRSATIECIGERIRARHLAGQRGVCRLELEDSNAEGVRGISPPSRSAPGLRNIKVMVIRRPRIDLAVDNKVGRRCVLRT
jgi:hypothetical protein